MVRNTPLFRGPKPYMKMAAQHRNTPITRGCVAQGIRNIATVLRNVALLLFMAENPPLWLFSFTDGGKPAPTLAAERRANGVLGDS